MLGIPSLMVESQFTQKRLPILIDQWTSLALYPWYANLKRKIPITSHRSTLNQYESAINPSKLLYVFSFFFWVKSTISYDFQCFPYGFSWFCCFDHHFPMVSLARWAPQPTFLVRTTCAVPPTEPPAEGEDPPGPAPVGAPLAGGKRPAAVRATAERWQVAGWFPWDYTWLVSG
jgi:hypothetical protein